MKQSLQNERLSSPGSGSRPERRVVTKEPPLLYWCTRSPYRSGSCPMCETGVMGFQLLDVSADISKKKKKKAASSITSLLSTSIVYKAISAMPITFLFDSGLSYTSAGYSSAPV